MTNTAQPSNQELIAVLSMAHLNEQDLCESIRIQFPRTFEEYQAEIREINEANGWFEDDRSFGDDVALLHSEVSEMFEAFRDNDHGTLICKQCGASTSYSNATEHLDHCGSMMKPEGLGSEAADILVRLLDTCERHGIDLRSELERKLAYNRTRGYKHGGKRV